MSKLNDCLGRANVFLDNLVFTRKYHANRNFAVAIIVAFFIAGAVTQQSVAAETTASVREDQLDDIATFRSGFLAVDRAYSEAARTEAEHRIAALERKAGRVSPSAFRVEICRIVALADNGHSTCWAHESGVGLSFSSIGNEFYVLKAAPENADLLGARLLSIDGQSMQRIRPAIRSTVGGVSAHRDLIAAAALARPALLQALGITHDAALATYRLETLDGHVVERELATENPSPGWVNLESEHAAWAAQEMNESFRWRDAPELNAVVIQLRQNMDRGNRKIAAFLEEAETARERLDRRNIVLDMRWNPGGNFLTTRDFILAWPQRVPAPGRFFVLIGPTTFSAGIASVAYLKQAAPDRVTLIGEPVGDRLMFFAENITPVRLPHSKIILIPALERDDFKDGCKPYNDCLVVLAQPGGTHGTPPDQANLLEQFGRKPLQVDSLDPDVSAPWTLRDYLSGRDPGIEAVAALAAEPKKDSN